MADIPDARFWHASQCVGDRVYIWGGYTKGDQEKLPFFEFDINKRTWRALTDIDVDPQDAHPATSQVACASYSDFLYLFGGSDQKELNNVLSKLDLKKKKWIRLTQQENASMSPMKKDACGMAHFTTQSGEHILIVMCGYSNTSRTTDAKSKFEWNKNSQHPDGDSGWTNEIHMFDTAKDNWSVPEITGTRPEPCADVTLTSIDEQRGLFYGGREEIRLYLIDINSMNIEVCESSSSKFPPKRLGFHSVGCIGYNSGKACLFMTGGRRDYNKDSKPLSDIWMFNPQSKRWKEETINDHDHAKMARWGHTVTVIMHTDSLVEVLMFGGSSDPFNLDNIPSLAQPISLIYGYGYHISDEWTLIGIVDKTENYRQFGTSLKGVEILQTTTVTVTNSKCTFEWERYGLKLHIPENSLPSDTKQITLTIIASTAGHYKFPEKFSLFSGVYWFCYEPLNVKLQLKKPVRLEIQHCAKPDCTSSLSFVRASSSPEKLPYTFKCLKGGDFTSSYGALEVNNFCGICIAGMSRAKKYLARVFYRRHETVCWDICIAVISDDDAHRRASERKFAKAADHQVSIDFESDEITLDIPQEALEIEGWILYPISTGYPMIKKERVDNPLPGQIPHCRILADIVDPGKARRKPLYHRVNLQGAKPQSDFINLKLVGDGGGGSAHDSSGANTTSDNPPTLPTMLRILRPVSSQWMNIGVMLSLNYGRLTAIETRRRGDPDDCLREMLNEWLQQTDPPPTKSALINAVEIYNPSLAEEISAL